MNDNLLLLKSLMSVLFVGIIIQCTSQESAWSTEYPEPLPDSAALRFLPGIVSRDSLDFNSAFSRDGSKFYFAGSAKGKWIIYMSEWKEGTWNKPVLAPFTELDYSQADPFVSADGTIYYISNRPRNATGPAEDFDIWYVRPQRDGSWSKPENLGAVNSDSTEYYVSVADNGNVYFASNRKGSLGDHDIYMSRYEHGKYSTPENLGPSINSLQMEHDPMIAPDESYMIFTSVDRNDSKGSGDLYYSLRNADGSWSQAKNMGNKVNTDTYEYCSYVTPDGKYLFYSSEFDVKWIGTSQFSWMTH
ncbi:hypothetical protein WBG78_13800 [Chryseolinea sp. T2]|uniref:TolB family protein n=1 Tax=Chryseolinea sp. T2 TaxID=3129255 RepID=UPI003077CFD4